MRRIAWPSRGVVLFVAVGAALLVGSGGPALAANPNIRFDPSPKTAPSEAAYYGASNVDTFSGDDVNVGDTATTARRAQGFKLAASTRALRAGLWLKKAGVPTDNLTVEIQPNAGGLPSGTPVTNGTSNTVAASALSVNDFRFVTFTFATPPQLTGGTQYHLVLKRSGAPDSFSYYVWGADQSSPSYANGAGSVYNSPSGPWTATSPDTDHAFAVNATGINVVVEGLQSGNELGAYAVTVAYDPAVVTPLAIQDGGFLGSTGRSVSCLSSVYGSGTVHFSCLTLSPPPPMGPTGSGTLVTVTFGPVAAGSTSLQLLNDCTASQGQETCLTRFDSTVIPHVALDGSLTVKSLGLAGGDSDGDGCSDVKEAGDNIINGGNRDWTNPWDFYDVPVPTNRDPTPNGTRNRAIDMSDVIGVLFYAGVTDNGPANGNGVDYDSDKNGDTVEDGRDYDRTAAAPTSGPPDGGVSLSDVITVLGQSGHCCP